MASPAAPGAELFHRSAEEAYEAAVHSVHSLDGRKAIWREYILYLRSKGVSTVQGFRRLQSGVQRCVMNIPWTHPVDTPNHTLLAPHPPQEPPVLPSQQPLVQDADKSGQTEVVILSPSANETASGSGQKPVYQIDRRSDTFEDYSFHNEVWHVHVRSWSGHVHACGVMEWTCIVMYMHVVSWSGHV